MSEPEKTVTQENELLEGEQGGGQQEDGQQQEQTKTDPNAELRSAMTELAGTVKKLAAPADDKKDLTDDEKAELWAIYNPEKSRPTFIKEFFRLSDEEATPEKIKAVKELFDDMHKGFVKQAVVGARNLFTVELEKVKEEFKGISDYVAKQRAKETRDSFNTAYPVLADKKYDKIVALCAKNIDQSKFDTDEKYFKALADSAADAINMVRDEAGLEKIDLSKTPEETPGKTKTSATTPRTPRTSVGGTGGAGGGSRPAKQEGSSEDQSNELVD